MWEFIVGHLRDPVWQFVFGFSAILVTVLLFLADRKRKELSYFSVWTFKLASDGKSHFETVRLVVMLANTGRVPILPADFERPIRFYMPAPSRILEASITKTNPSNIHPKMLLEEEKIILSPLLLNPGDSISFEATTTAFRWRNQICADGRIAGVKEIHRIYSPASVAGGYAIAITGLIMAFMAALGIPRGLEIVRLYLTFLGIVLAAFALYGPWKTRIKKSYSKESFKALWKNQFILWSLQKRLRKRQSR